MDEEKEEEENAEELEEMEKEKDPSCWGHKYEWLQVCLCLTTAVYQTRVVWHCVI